jgi:hypothetical protein
MSTNKFQNNLRAADSLLLEVFFKSVLGQKIDASDLALAPDTHPSLMINQRTMSLIEIVERGQKYFRLTNDYQYKKLSEVSGTTDRPSEQYTFAHVGGLQRDMPGLSYNDAKIDKVCFLNHEEYALATFYNKWRHGEWLDQLGWARLDALWSDGEAVCACWCGDQLDWYWIDPDDRNGDGGPRSEVLAKVRKLKFADFLFL